MSALTIIFCVVVGIAVITTIMVVVALGLSGRIREQEEEGGDLTALEKEIMRQKEK